MDAMLNRPMTFRVFALCAAIVLALCAGNSSAQKKDDAGAIPFFPKGFGGNPEEFFEQMFGKSTPEESRELEAVKIPFRDEREFGEPQVEAYLAHLKEQGLRVVRKGKDVEYLRKLVETIHPFLKNARRYDKLTIYLVDSPRVDARTFPGGTLFFHKGLLSFAGNEAALAGIVGHELSHLDRGHLLVPLKRGKIMERKLADGAAGFDPQKFFTTGTTMMRLVGRPFRPEDESEADRDGAAWAYRAGYDPREMAGLFARLHQRDNDPKIPFASFFRTHPYSDDRSDAILRQYDELQASDPRENPYRGKENLARRIPRSQQEFPE
ncbi:MAG: M48 family metallopeptidase [Deltaproteobacteria bacterium]